MLDRAEIMLNTLFVVAEVADKMPRHFGRFLAIAVVSAFLIFFLSRFRWWLGVVFLLVPLAVAVGLLQEFTDPAFSNAIERELGSGYILQAYAAVAALIFVPLAAAIVGARTSRNARAV